MNAKMIEEAKRLMEKTREGFKMGQWSLWRLDDQWNGEKRWSIGVNGPRMYLTCDEETATWVLFCLANTDICMKEI